MTELSDEQLIGAIRKTLGRSKTLGLATVGEDGHVHAANVNFVSDDDLNLYWLSKPESMHSAQLSFNPNVAATAYPHFRLPNRIRGVQVRGHACEMKAEEFDTTWKLYRAKFPYAAAFKNRVQNEDRFYRLSSNWLRLIDNTVAFGFKAETRWPIEEA